MNELVKWVWILLLGVLFAGGYFFIGIAVAVVVYVLVVWLKPEWLNRD